MQKLLLVTGLSGAGKSLVMRALEDINYYCIDNLPADMLCELIQAKELNERYADRLAITVDTRSGEDFQGVLNALKHKTDDLDIKILFLDADDGVLSRRYKETRRCHPLTIRHNLSIDEAINRERLLLANLYEIADYIIDTGLLSTSTLKQQIVVIFSNSMQGTMPISIISFGFKYGVPRDADLMFDVRCLPNPFYIVNLKEKTGLDNEVFDYVFSFNEAGELFEKISELISYSIPLYLKEGKSRLTVAIGCTGGKHRSVSFARNTEKLLANQGYTIDMLHRDIQRR